MKVVALLCVLCAGLILAGGQAIVRGEDKADEKGTVHTVKMTNAGGTNVFDPPKITIKVGDSVKWVDDGGTHTATSDDIKTGDPKQTFNTGTVKKGQEATITFNKAGTYPYHCEFHAPMKGEITVE